MCSHFLKRMENYQGDLADIFRASRSTIDGGVAAAAAPAPRAHLSDWQFSRNPINYSFDPAEDFGDPFPNMRDPLLHRIDLPGFAVSGGDNYDLAADRILDDDMKRPANIFSRMLQISPSAKLPVVSPAMVAEADGSPRGLKGPPMPVSDNRTLIFAHSSKGCSMESPDLQISSPRNTGIKRRKNHAKKVVCIPAPAPANSRTSGEIVPSDLWAWRKYGQKPIKGSPYPRGYYRCSSSKGCPARKQVERSRNDPNMLVISYTSDHNHPWPTQRNALAGSIRSQPSKSSAAAKSTSPNYQSGKPTNSREDQKEIKGNPLTLSTVDPNSASVKEETDRDLHNPLETDDIELDEEFLQSCKPTLLGMNKSEDSFFADFGEIEADPLDLLFRQGFSDHYERENKGLDPFCSFFD